MPAKVTISLKLEVAMEVKAAIEEKRDRTHAEYLVAREELKQLREEFEIQIHDDVEQEIVDDKADKADVLMRRVAMLSDALLEF